MQKVYSPKVHTEFSHQTAAQLRISTTVWVDFFSFFKNNLSAVQFYKATRQSIFHTYLFNLFLSVLVCACVWFMWLSGASGCEVGPSIPDGLMQRDARSVPASLSHLQKCIQQQREGKRNTKEINTRETRGSWNKVNSCPWWWGTRWRLKKVMSFMIRMLMLTTDNYWQH